MKNIDCFLLGAHKCASTSLFNVLRQHSDITTHSGNQLEDFLSADDYLARYAQILSKEFSQVNSGQLSLAREMTAYADPRLLSRLYALNPDARLILIIREPVQRAVSAYHYSLNNGFSDGGISLERAIENWENGRRSGSSLLINDYIGAGFYHAIISGIVNVFPREQLKVVSLEDFSKNTGSVANQLFEFLELSHQKVDPATDNVQSSRRFLKLHTYLRDKNGVLKKGFRLLFPRSMRVRLFHTLIKMNKKRHAGPEIPEELLARLKAIYQHDVSRLYEDFQIKFDNY